MKGLIGKKKKDSQETPVGLPEQPAQEQRPPLQALLPGLAVAACGLLLGLACSGWSTSTVLPNSTSNSWPNCTPSS